MGHIMLKNRNQRVAGRLRVAVPCPACGSACLTKASQMVSSRTREYRLACTNELCGWTGVGHFEVARTISPPSKRYKTDRLPPEVDAEYLANPPPEAGQLFAN